MINIIKYIGTFEFISKPLFKTSAAITTANKPSRDEIDEILSTFAQNPHTRTPIKVGIGRSTKNTPKPVATPFPPSSPKYML